MPTSCEFLSIWYIYQSNYNKEGTARDFNWVVSSFQFGIFIKVITTAVSNAFHDLAL